MFGTQLSLLPSQVERNLETQCEVKELDVHFFN